MKIKMEVSMSMMGIKQDKGGGGGRGIKDEKVMAVIAGGEQRIMREGKRWEGCCRVVVIISAAEACLEYIKTAYYKAGIREVCVKPQCQPARFKSMFFFIIPLIERMCSYIVPALHRSTDGIREDFLENSK